MNSVFSVAKKVLSLTLLATPPEEVEGTDAALTTVGSVEAGEVPENRKG